MKIDVKINLKQIAHNIGQYNSKVILMVKGDAYGHGLEEVSRYVEPLVYGFGVATLEEGVRLRDSGISKNILVCQCLKEEIPCAVAQSLIVSVGDFDTLDCAIGNKAQIAVKINTGMNRFGFSKDSLSLLKERLSGLSVSGIYSHIYSPQMAEKQLDLFHSATAFLEKDCEKHIFASSTATTESDILRIGFNAYKGAMAVESRVVAVAKVKKGDNVGYGNTVAKDGNIAWIFGGYADGINRERPQPILLDGKLCPVIAVCMDTLCAYTGDYVGKIGGRAILQNNVLTPEYIAQQTSTIPYTVLTGRSGRINRIYIQ